MQALKINKLDIAALISGLVFGVGLLLSGMANPKKVLDFLDIFGAWDPTLAWVMGGAILVTLPIYWPQQDNFSLGRPYSVAKSNAHRP